MTSVRPLTPAAPVLWLAPREWTHWETSCVRNSCADRLRRASDRAGGHDLAFGLGGRFAAEPARDVFGVVGNGHLGACAGDGRERFEHGAALLEPARGD